jgi:hypothetical protein
MHHHIYTQVLSACLPFHGVPKTLDKHQFSHDLHVHVKFAKSRTGILEGMIRR